MSNSLDEIYRKTEEAVERKIGSSIILVPLKVKNPQNPHIFSIEGAGKNIWQLIDGKRKLREISKILFQEFPAEKSQLLNDLFEFIEQLKTIGGIEQCQSAQTFQR